MTFSIPNWTPPNLNDALGAHFSVIQKMKRDAADVLGIYAVQAGVKRIQRAGSSFSRSGKPEPQPRRRVTIRVRGWYAGTLPDSDNLLKITLDALTRAHLIVDDSSEWLECPMPTVTRAAKGESDETTITIEDIE